MSFERTCVNAIRVVASGQDCNFSNRESLIDRAFISRALLYARRRLVRCRESPRGEREYREKAELRKGQSPGKRAGRCTA